MAEVWPPITVATPPLPLAGRKVAGGVFDGNSWAKVLLPEKATFESAPHTACRWRVSSSVVPLLSLRYTT